MADEPPRRIELSITPPGTGPDRLPVEEGYRAAAEVELEREWSKYTGAQQEEQAPAATAPRQPAQPSAVATGGKAAVAAIGGGMERFAVGLRDFLKPVQAPGEPVLGGEPVPAGAGKTAVFGAFEKTKAVGDMLMGLMGVLSSPGAGIGAGLQQAAKNITPEQEQAVVFPGGPGGLAPLIRSMVGDPRPFGTDPAARMAGEAPMTLGEVVNLVGQLGTAAAIPAAVKGARKLPWREERGSIILRPGAEQGGAAATAGESRVNVARVDAPETTKAIMTEINRSLAEALEKHRRVQGHAETIAAAPRMTVEQALAVDPTLLTLTEAKGVQLAVRDVYNAAAQHVDRLVKGAQAGDAAALEQLPVAWATLGRLAILDEVLGATAARLLESRKILSEASRAVAPGDAAAQARRAEAVARVTEAEQTVATLSAAMAKLERTSGVAALEKHAVGLEARARALEAQLGQATEAKATAAVLKRHLAEEASHIARLRADLAKATEGGMTPALDRALERQQRAVETLTQRLADARTDEALARVVKQQIADEGARATALREAIEQVRKETPNLDVLQRKMERAQAKVDDLRAKLVDVREAAKAGQMAEQGYAYAAADIEALVEAIRFAETDPAQLARMLGRLNARQRRHFAREAVRGLHVGQNILMEAWINALLSGPQTHAANILSNSLVAAWAPAERALSAMLDLGTPRSVFLGEAPAMVYGALRGIQDGIRLLGKAWEEKTLPARRNEKVEIAPTITSDTFGLAPDSILGKAVDYFGHVVRSPGAALTLEDALFKAVNYRMELHALAYRTAAQQGLSGADFAKAMRRTIDRPPPTVKVRADDFALIQTFNAEFSGLSGRAGRAVSGAAYAVPMLRVVTPFVRTPTNILQYVGQRTPILNLLSETLRADIAAGGERRALAFGKIAGGTMVAALTAELAAAGIITGDGPKDEALRRQKRDTGWQPCSLKLGDTYYAINRLDPLGAIACITASAVEIIGELPEYTAYELVSAVKLATIKHMTSKSYLEGLSNWLESLTEPGQASEANLGKFAKGLARSAVPNIIRQANRAYIDPTVREARDLVDQVRAGVPGYSSDLPPRRNLFGDPIVLGGGLGPDIISPIYTSAAKDDPVADEIVRLGVRLTMPPKYIPVSLGREGLPAEVRDLLEAKALAQTTTGLRLTPEEYDRLVVLGGKGIPGGDGVTLHERIAGLMATPEYQQQSDGVDGGKALAIQKVVNLYKQRGLAQLQEESPELREAMARVKAEKLIRRTPTAAQGDARRAVEQLINSLTR